MKKFYIVLILLLAFAGISRAQIIEDFESIKMNLMAGGVDDLSSFIVIANPDATGANTSGMVCKFIRDKDGVAWGGFYASVAIPIDVTTNKYIHVKVWKPRISPVHLKLESGAQPNLEIQPINPQTVVNGWEELVFDFSATTGAYNTLTFMPDFNDPVGLTEDITIYFDNFYVNNDPAVGSAPLQVIEDYEHIGLNYMLGGAEDLSSMTLIPNPDPTGIDKSDYVVKFLRDKDGVAWGGFWSSLPTPADVTTNKYVHVKVWKPRISPLHFKLEGGAAGTLELPSTQAQIKTGAWEDIVFDFTSKTGTYPTIALMPDFEDPLTLTDDITIYFDDILINNDPNPIASATMLTLNVDMHGSGLTAAQPVYFSGTFGGVYGTWNEPGTNANCQLTDADGDSIYSVVIELAQTGAFQFKFFKGTGWNGGEWIGDPNRSVTVTGDMTVNYKWGEKVSGVNENLLTAEVNAYPVPFGNTLTINSLIDVKTVVITSSYGQQVARFDNLAPGTTTINTSQLASGMYFVTFYSKSGKQVTKKLIKN